MDCVSDARLAVSRTTSRETPKLLNLGCGSRFHPTWVNFDIAPIDPSIRRWDVTEHLPFPDVSVDAVYHAHLLEHLPHERALPFLEDCRRVLKPGGVLRIAIPNLEAIARLYLHALEESWYGDRKALDEHRWLVMELYDQATRESTGGAMLEYLQDEATELAWYRLGADGAVIKQNLSSRSHLARPTWRERMRGWLLG